MKKQLRLVFAVVLIMMGAAGLMAAGGGEAEDLKTEAAEKPLVMWGLEYDPHVQAYERLAELYRQTVGGEISVEPQSGDITAKLVASIAAGTPPDLMCLLGWVKLPLVEGGALIEVSEEVFEYVGVDPERDFIGDAIGAYTYKGGIYGVPFETTGVGFMINVPTDEMKQLGIYDQYPPGNGEMYFDSYEQLWELAEILQTEEDGVVTRWGLNSTGWEKSSFLGILNTLLDQETPGQRWWDPENETYNIDNPQFLEAIDLYIMQPVFERGIEAFSTLNNSDALLQGQAAVGRGNGTPSVLGGDYGYTFEMVLAPKINGQKPLYSGEGGWGMMGIETANNRAGAVEFLRMAATDAGQMAYAKIYGGLMNIAWAGLVGETTRFEDQSSTNPLLAAAKVFDEAMTRNEFYGVDYGYPNEINAIFGTNLSLVREGSLSPEEAAEAIQEQLEEQYARYLEDQ